MNGKQRQDDALRRGLRCKHRRRLMRIIGSEQVKEALRAALIDAIERTGGDEYRVYGGKCAVIVRIKDLPLPEGMVGARRFELDVGKAECTN